MHLIKSLVLSLTLAFLPLGVDAQQLIRPERVSPTTDMEYHYLTSEYGLRHAKKDQVKTGYVLEHLATYFLRWTHDGEKEPVVKTIDFKAFKRNGEASPCAILCVCTSSVSDNVEYFCLPTIDADKKLWTKFRQQQQSQDEEWAQVWFWGLSHLSAIFMR